MVYSSRIKEVRFEVSGDADILSESDVPIKSYDLLKSSAPYPGGLYDGHLGTLDHTYTCQTCFNNKKNCTGHDGHLMLNYPVFNPIYVNEIKKWLRLICFKCGASIINVELVSRFPVAKRLDEASKLARTGVKICPQCKTEHPTIGKDKEKPLLVTAKLSNGAESKIYPHMIKEILSKIKPELVTALGKNPVKAHPEKFILSVFKIPPITIRPDVKKSGTSRNGNNPLTTLLQNIIRKNEKIPQPLPNDISEQLSTDIFALEDIVYAYIRGSQGKQIISGGGNAMLNSLAARLKGKQGLHRKNQLGKRVRVVARTTITGDPTLRINEVGIPIKFAKILQIEEIVQEFNKHRLMTIFLNGKKKYPGCSKIVRKATGTEHSIEDPYTMQELAIGDRIFRDLQTGDYVLYNRQPSLLPSSISGMRVVITMDPEILTFRMNVIACPFFNADFDGDQMNIYGGRSLACRMEIKRHSGIQNWFIKHASSAPMIGQADDSIIGLFMLTRNHVKFNKYNAMQLFSTCTWLPSFTKSPTDTYSCYDIISMHFSDTPINFTRTPTYYNANLISLVDYDPSDIKVVIERGVHKSGVLDKKSVGKGAINGINHLICSEYGENKALDSIYNMQQLALNYMHIHGFSIGILDIIVSDKALDEIHKIESSLIDKSLFITERLNDGKIIPPVGKTTEQFYEEEQINTLRVMDDFAEPIFRDIDVKSNNLAQLVLSGSKGTTNHIYHISSAIGQIVINDQRPKQQYAYGRTLAHFTRFAMEPEARGFIRNSYISGMNAVEFAFNAQNARADFITKALYTAVTGESERKSIKNLESLVVNNLRMCVKYNNIVQLLYGEDGLDTRKMIEVNIPSLLISDSVLEAKFKYVCSVDNATSPQYQTVFDNEFKTLVEMRRKYRAILLNLEKCKFNEPLTANKSISVDVDKLVVDAIHEYGEQKPTDAEIAEMVGTVDTLCANIGYIMMNEICERNRVKIPEHILHANGILVFYIRSILCAKYSLRRLNIQMLNAIVDRIRIKQTRALCAYGTAVGIIAAMSFSEPLTQYMLDAHHRTTTGGTSKSAMTTVKEVLGARSKENLTSSSMVLTPYDEYQDVVRLTSIANNIEVNVMRNFVRISQIFYERYGSIVHPDYLHENELVSTFEAQNPSLRPPADLLRWCIRLVLNKSVMIYKNMTLETIIIKLRDVYPDLHIVYNTETASQLVIRIYIRNVYFKSVGHINQTHIEELRDSVLGTAIRGMPDILSASVTKLMRSEIMPDGSIARATNKHCIVTNGTNFADAFKIAEIDPYSIQTDSIDEIQQVLGIEAARQKLFTSIRNLGAGGLNMHHVSIYVDEMTYTGVVTSIEKQGLNKRETNNVLLRMGFSSPLQTLEEAAINSMTDPVQGVTSPLLIGDIPLTIGTAYNEFHMNENIIKGNTTRPDDWLDNLGL